MTQFRTEDLQPHPYADLFPLMSEAEYAELLGSMREHGYRASEPVVLFEGSILDGRNRFTAAQEADVLPAFRKFDPESEGPALDYVLDLNLHRRHLTDDQRRIIAAELVTLGRGRPGGENAANSGISRTEAAKRLSADEAGVERARSVVAHGITDLRDAVRQGKASVSAAAEIARLPQDEQKRVLAEIAAQPETKRAFTATVKELRRERQDEKRSARETREADLGARQAALPDKHYGVILADPEWRFEPWSRETGMDRAADNHYPTSVTEVIAARPVGEIAAADSVLLLCATVPMLPHALAVMAAWGFDYRSHIVWRKAEDMHGSSRPGKLVLGTGYWFRNGHELLLLGVRGNVPAPAMGEQWPSVKDSPPLKHSQKPDWFYDLIEAYFPNLPKIELNARRARPGWDAWGLEAPASDEPFDPETGEIIEGEAVPSPPSRAFGATSPARGEEDNNNPPSEGGGGIVESPSAANISNAGSRDDINDADPVPEDAMRAVRQNGAAGGEAALDAVPPPADLEIPPSLRRIDLKPEETESVARLAAGTMDALSLNQRQLVRKLVDHPGAATLLDRQYLAKILARTAEAA